MIRSLSFAIAVVALPSLASAEAFIVSSTDFKDGATWTSKQVYKGMGCNGDNASPQLAWKGAPAGTRSFAVTVYDPDAPTGSGWWHWVVYNLPATTLTLPAGAGDVSKKLLAAPAVQGHTDYGATGFGGACPPPGDKPHAYVVTVFALKVPRIDVPENATAAMVGFYLNADKLGTAKLTGKFGR